MNDVSSVKVTENRIYLEGPYILVDVRDSVDDVDIQYLVDEMAKASAKRRAANQPALFLCDISNVHSSTPRARKLGLNLMKDLDVDRFALINPKNPFIRFTTNAIFNAIGRENIKTFKNRDSATKWLNEFLSYGKS